MWVWLIRSIGFFRYRFCFKNKSNKKIRIAEAFIMKASAIFSFVIVIIAVFNVSVEGFTGFNPLEWLLGHGEFLIRAFYVVAGVCANFLVAFAAIFRPFKRLN